MECTRRFIKLDHVRSLFLTHNTTDFFSFSFFFQETFFVSFFSLLLFSKITTIAFGFYLFQDPWKICLSATIAHLPAQLSPHQSNRLRAKFLCNNEKKGERNRRKDENKMWNKLRNICFCFFKKKLFFFLVYFYDFFTISVSKKKKKIQ